jgi:hypothetical protein
MLPDKQNQQKDHPVGWSFLASRYFIAFGVFFHRRILAAMAVLIVDAPFYFASLSAELRELDGETKPVVKSLLPIMVEIACVSTGMADGVNTFPIHFIRTMAFVPPDA